MSLNKARSKARDARRKHDLHTIQTALEFYYDDHDTYKIPNTSYAGAGNGFFSQDYDNGGPIKSTAQALLDGGYVSHLIVDPSGAEGGNVGGAYSGYMIHLSADNEYYTLWANLENPTNEEKLQECRLSDYDNYRSSGASPYAEKARMNYCIGN